MRAASWDLGQVRLADPKTGVILYRLFPLDKQKNAQGERSAKGSPVDKPALRGSSELAGWGDSNLYMRRRGAQLTLSTEHRAAASQESGGRQTLQRVQQILGRPGSTRHRPAVAHALLLPGSTSPDRRGDSR